jgi:hypothetical protein
MKIGKDKSLLLLYLGLKTLKVNPLKKLQKNYWKLMKILIKKISNDVNFCVKKDF